MLWILGAAVSPRAEAQADGYHWAYASYFGTGRYTLDGVNETMVLSMAPSWSWREPQLDESGARTIGYRFHFPISVAASDFVSLDSIGDVTLDSIGALSAVPGVEVDIPIGPRWSLKPLGHLGLGYEFSKHETARMFNLGIRSRFLFQLEDTAMELVNSLERIGYEGGDGTSDALNLLLTGLDFSRGLRNKRIGGSPVVLHWHVSYTRYLDSLNLDVVRTAAVPSVDVTGEWELGMAFGRQGGKIGIWRLNFDRVGLAYRVAADGEFSGVSVIFQSLFER